MAYPARPAEERFFEKLVQDGECWTFNSRRTYGTFRFAPALQGLAHRWAWEFWNGPIPAGLQVDHLCFNKGCVNPAHLDVVPPRTNVHRAPTHNATKTSCLAGHAFTAANTYVNPDGHRACRTCNKLKMRVRRANN